jgi:hypothetical protein
MEAVCPPKRRWNSTGLHAITSQKTVVFIKLNGHTYKEDIYDGKLVLIIEEKDNI